MTRGIGILTVSQVRTSIPLTTARASQSPVETPKGTGDPRDDEKQN